MTVFTVELKGDVKHILNDLKDHPNKIVIPSINRSLNKTISQVKTKAVRELAAALGIPAYHIAGRKGKSKSVVKPRIYIKPSTFKTLTTKLSALTAGIPLINLPKKFISFRSPTGAMLFKGGAFQKRMSSGYTGIFKRDVNAASSTGRDSKGRLRKNRLKIHEQRLDIKPDAERIIDKLIKSFAIVKFREIFEKELQFRISGLK